MIFTDAEQDFLTTQRLGRLATVAPDGRPQVKPVGFRLDPAAGTIDIAGYQMERSAKFRNIGVHPDVAFEVDEVVGGGPEGVRLLEVRGRAEAVSVPATDHLSAQIIRIHPYRVLAWNIAEPGLSARNVPG